MSAWLKTNMVSWETKFLQTGEVSAQSDALQSYDLIVLTRAYIILPLNPFGSEFIRPLCKGKEFLCFCKPTLSYQSRVGGPLHWPFYSLKRHSTEKQEIASSWPFSRSLWLPVNFWLARRGTLLISRRYTCETLKTRSQMTSKDNNHLKEYCFMPAI